MSQLCCRLGFHTHQCVSGVEDRDAHDLFTIYARIRNQKWKFGGFRAALVSAAVDGVKDLCIARVEFQRAPSSP